MSSLGKSFWLVCPFAVWMVLMSALPSTATGYAIRTVAVAVLLLVGLFRLRPTRATCSFAGLGVAVLVGICVFALWILPEQFDWTWYRRFCIVGEGGTQSVAEAGVLMIAIRLFGSSFVIPVAEEMFFRKWLISFAGFWPMVALFAVEHDRWLVGAIAGIAYGVLYLRKGIAAAIAAHATTNLVLGLWVIKSGQWQFW